MTSSRCCDTSRTIRDFGRGLFAAGMTADVVARPLAGYARLTRWPRNGHFNGAEDASASHFRGGSRWTQLLHAATVDHDQHLVHHKFPRPFAQALAPAHAPAPCTSPR